MILCMDGDMTREPLEEFLVVECDPLHEEASVGHPVLTRHPEAQETFTDIPGIAPHQIHMLYI